MRFQTIEPTIFVDIGRFVEAGLATWLPTAEAVRSCTDKWRFARVCRDHAIPAPATALGSAEGVPEPWIVKPRFGRGSRDVYTVDTVDDLRWVLPRVHDPLVQTRICSEEFTVDALVDPHGQLAGAVPRWRLETRHGYSFTLIERPKRRSGHPRPPVRHDRGGRSHAPGAGHAQHRSQKGLVLRK